MNNPKRGRIIPGVPTAFIEDRSNHSPSEQSLYTLQNRGVRVLRERQPRTRIKGTQATNCFAYDHRDHTCKCMNELLCVKKGSCSRHRTLLDYHASAESSMKRAIAKGYYKESSRYAPVSKGTESSQDFEDDWE